MPKNGGTLAVMNERDTFIIPPRPINSEQADLIT